MSELLTLKEVCAELNISASTAYYWRQKGQGPRAAKFGKQLRYRRSDLDQWLGQQFDADEKAQG